MEKNEYVYECFTGTNNQSKFKGVYEKVIELK
jgi:hypothetical protein